MATTYDYNQAKSQCDLYREEFRAIVEKFRSDLPENAKRIYASFHTFYPRQQFFYICANDGEGKPDNGVFVEFSLDLTDKTVTVNREGAIYVSDEDKRRSGAVMVDLKTLVKARDGKWMRKTKYKDASDFRERVGKFFEEVMEIVTEYTGGYPYEKGLTPVYPIR